MVVLEMDSESAWEIECASLHDWLVVRVEKKWENKDFTEVSYLNN